MNEVNVVKRKNMFQKFNRKINVENIIMKPLLLIQIYNRLFVQRTYESFKEKFDKYSINISYNKLAIK